ncbi:MAG: MFS transporter [Acidobacteria bacterium]|nr:MAG: MFS transporter [Acidobacteriota bacterium]
MAEVKLKAKKTETAGVNASLSGFQVPGLRWWIIGLVFLATVINYIDRQTIAILSTVIRADLSLSNEQYALINAWFLLAYTISQSLSGKLYDRVGTRKGFSFSIIIWSVAAMMTSLAQGLRSLSLFRFLLGTGEAGNWPGAAKISAEWFPIKERALALAIFNSGATVGAVLSPPLIVWLNINYGWHSTFLITGTLGFFWLALWLFVYQTPERHRWLKREEFDFIRKGQRVEDESLEAVVKDEIEAPSVEVIAKSAPPADLEEERVPRWRELLQYREVWAIVLMRFLVDPVWWLFVIWLPEYLQKARGFSLKDVGSFAWLPYLTAGIGSLLGGWASGYLIGLGWTVNRARKSVMLIAALLMPTGILAVRVADPMVALALICVVTFAFQVWINNLQVLPSDYFPGKAVASVAGLGGTGAGISSLAFTLATGWVVDHFSYTPIFTAAGLFGPLGAIVLFTLAGPIRRVPLERNDKAAI